MDTQTLISVIKLQVLANIKICISESTDYLLSLPMTYDFYLQRAAVDCERMQRLHVNVMLTNMSAYTVQRPKELFYNDVL